ncbi:hypothetical protein CWS02_08795 [Enterobacter sp. EA-1]|nr:hypothetical protein CWS02_08795 [Enterobacter sp. EA-1]
MNYEGEVQELMSLYVKRGLEPALAHQVAEQLMAHDALDAHAREELGLTDTNSARPLQAALFSAVSFSAGAVLPVMVAPVNTCWVCSAVGYPLHAVVPGGTRIHFIRCREGASGDGNYQNYVLERAGDGAFDGSRFACRPRAGIASWLFHRND